MCRAASRKVIYLVVFFWMHIMSYTDDPVSLPQALHVLLLLRTSFITRKSHKLGYVLPEKKAHVQGMVLVLEMNQHMKS